MSLYVISENKRLINVENHLIFNREEQAPPLQYVTVFICCLHKSKSHQAFFQPVTCIR